VTRTPRDRILRKFGASLASRRHEAGFSQERLANISGLHRTYIGGLERGERNPTVATLVALAAALDCSVAELVEEI
jgi:transcriptional regulator with XRE-family HTH domain